MFKNYFIVTLRNLKKQKGYNFINILGLAVGLAASIFIFMYVSDELSYDTLHPNAENLYRIGVKVTNQEGEENFYGVGLSGWDNYLVDNFEEVKSFSSFRTFGFPFSLFYESDDNIRLTQDMELFFVESNYTEMIFTSIIDGNREKPLEEPNTMVISKTGAKELFGDENPVGKIISVSHMYATNGEKIEVKITAVMDDIPGNFHLRPKYLVNVYSLAPYQENLYNRLNTMTDPPFFVSSFLVIDNPEKIELLKQTLVEQTKKMGENAENEITIDPIFRKVTDLHFDKEIDWNFTTKSSDLKYIYGFISIAIFIILIACINYLNLSTAKSMERGKEVGLRKTLGSSRTSIFAQFMVESFLYVFIAVLIALALVVLFLPTLNMIAYKEFTISNVFSSDMLMILLGILISVTLLAGGYPAIYISGLKPTTVLKGKFAFSKSSQLLRQLLTTVQFSISIIFLTVTIVVVGQMSLLKESQLNKSGKKTVSIRYSGFKQGEATLSKFNVFRNRLAANTAVESVSLASHLPRRDHFGPMDQPFIFPEIKEETILLDCINGDYNFPHVFNIDLIAGRLFDSNNPSDSNSFLINQAGAEFFNMDVQEMVGQPLIFPPSFMYSSQLSEEQRITGKIIGVVRDFPFNSMYNKISPLIISSRPHQTNKIIYVKSKKGSLQEMVAEVEKEWKEVYPDMGLDYWFVDDEFGRMYQNEDQMASMVENFSILAIIILCVGLYGLASFLTRQKSKEIGIRKSLGSTNFQILKLIMLIYFKLLLVAGFVGIPLSFLVSKEWLMSFSYKIELSPLIFTVGFGSIVLVTIITVVYEGVKASKLDPVITLKNN